MYTQGNRSSPGLRSNREKRGLQRPQKPQGDQIKGPIQGTGPRLRRQRRRRRSTRTTRRSTQIRIPPNSSVKRYPLHHRSVSTHTAAVLFHKCTNATASFDTGLKLYRRIGPSVIGPYNFHGSSDGRARDAEGGGKKKKEKKKGPGPAFIIA